MPSLNMRSYSEEVVSRKRCFCFDDNLCILYEVHQPESLEFNFVKSRMYSCSL